MSQARPDGLDLSNWREHPFSEWSFQHVREVVPTAAIPCRAQESSGAPDCGLEAVGPITAPGYNNDLGTLLAQSHSDAFLVLHNGQPVAAWRAAHMDWSNTHLLFSVSKSLTATVAGILQSRGQLDPGAPVSEYVTVAAGSAYSDCRVQHVLDMSVALDFEENYTAEAVDYMRYRRASGWNPVDQTEPLEGLRSLITAIGKLEDQHGRAFRYRSPNSDLLGMIVASAGAKPFATLASELLWQPMGARNHACITVDHFGEARTAGGICTTIDDLARVGQLFCDSGLAPGGERVLDPAWIDDTLRGGSREAWKQGDFAEILPAGRYRNKWYQFGDADESFCAMGIHGQYMVVNPKLNVVICRFASQPQPVDDAMEAAVLGTMSEIAAQFG